MKLRWAAALLALSGLGSAGAWASGFGFTVANATVVNSDPNNNGKADVGETFTVIGAKFSSYLSSGGAPAINDSDLNRYSADISGTATEVNGTEVRYQGTFTITYTGPAYPGGVAVETGNADFWASYNTTNGAAVLRGLFSATPGVPGEIANDPNFKNTDFAPYNDGRFYGIYTPNAGDRLHGTITANLNAGLEGFAASLNKATLTNNDANGNGRADVGETFTMTAGLASYYPTAGGLLPLRDNDLNRYSLVLNGTAAAVSGTDVTYTGTYALRYTGPAYPTGVDVETGTFNLAARYNEFTTGAAKLSGQFVAAAGVPTNLQTDVNFKNSDFAVFNPARFTGTYQPTTVGGATGTVSGSLIAGVMGFSASVGAGTIANGDENGNGIADVGETFTATGPLAAYLAVGAPPLLDKDLNRYTISLSGTATSVVDTTVVYTGTFKITYTGPALTADTETGIFTIVAVYNTTNGGANLSGTLRADAGSTNGMPPFELTDYAPFNPATLTGFYRPTTPGAKTGSFYGGISAGTLVQTLFSRKLGTGIEGSPTAATGSNDARYAVVVSGSTLFVLEPNSGRDAPGWEGGKPLDGTVIGRPSVLRDAIYVGTSAGTLYRFNLLTGALLNSGKPGGAGSKIYTAPAVVDHLLVGGTVDQVVVAVSNLNGTAASAVVRVPADNLGTPSAGPTTLSASAITVSSPAVPGNGNVFVGSQAGLFVLDYATLAIKSQTTDPTPTSPLVANGRVFVGTGDGSTFRVLNAGTLAQESAYNLQSPLILSAFWDKPNSLVQAGVLDGRVVSFGPTGSFVGLTLAGLFNPENTGGSYAMPVAADFQLFRATENKQILSGLPLNGDDQEVVDLVSAVRGAVSATGQTPGADFVIGTSPDGYVHMLGLPAAQSLPTTLVSIPLSKQINNGVTTNPQSPEGNAIYIPSSFGERLSFQTDPTGGFSRVSIKGGSWYYGPYVDFNLAGVGPVDISAAGTAMSFDARYFQDTANTKRYEDAPIFLRLYSYLPDNTTLTGYRDYSIVYATQAPWNNKAFPDWNRVTVDLNDPKAATTGQNGLQFNPNAVTRMRMYGTDWYTPEGSYTDFIDVRNLTITRP